MSGRRSTPDASPPTVAPDNDNGDPVAAALARFEADSAARLRELLADLRAAHRAPAPRPRLVLAPAPDPEAPPPDDLTRQLVLTILSRHSGRARGSR